MRYVLPALALLIATSGCRTPCTESSGICTVPNSCPPTETTRAEAAPETREVEVKAPRQKIVVEMPAPTTCKVPCAPEAPPPQVPTMTQAAYAPAMMAPMANTVAQPARMGFMFDTMRIPIPIIRPVAIPRPAEMTMTMPVATMPMMMVPNTAMMPNMAMAPNTAMVPQTPVGNASMNVQGSMSVQNAAAMLAALNNASPQQLAALAQMTNAGQASSQTSVNMQLTAEQIDALIAALRAARTPR